VIIEPSVQFAFWDDPRDTLSTKIKQGSSLDISLWESNKYQKSDTKFIIKKSGSYAVIVTDSLACSDTSSIIINFYPIPGLTTQDVAICQPSRELKIAETGIVVNPSNVGQVDVFLKCIDCGPYKPSDLIENKGTLTHPDYYLHLDAASMPLGTKQTDSIIVQIEYRDSNGCSALDTAMVAVRKTTIISHQGFRDLCWDEGIVDLKSMSQVTPSDGVWRAIDSSGFASASGLNSALRGDTLNGDTLNTLVTPRPAEKDFERYQMRYFHDRSGCVSVSDATLTIRGLPESKIDLNALSTPFDSTAPFDYCSTESIKSLNANYAGGTWSSDNPATISGSQFDPSKATVIGTPIEIKYFYTDIYGCQGSDSVEVTINKAEKLEVSDDSSFTWYSDIMQVWVDAKPTFGRKVKWEALDGGSFGNASANSTLFTFTTDKEVSTNVRVKATLNEGAGGCPAPESIINFFVHRTPCIDFTMDLDLSTKLLKLTPDIDSLASYRWTVKDSNSSDINAVIDVSGYTDSLVNVRLQTHNKGGDNCYTDKVLNLKNGSISPIDFQEIVLYPNPVLNGFTIQMKGKGVLEAITIYDVLGAKVSNIRTDENYVDCSDLSSGIYSVIITVGQEVYVTKFVKSDQENYQLLRFLLLLLSRWE